MRSKAFSRSLHRCIKELREFEYDAELEEIIEDLLELKRKWEDYEHGVLAFQGDDDCERDSDPAFWEGDPES